MSPDTLAALVEVRTTVRAIGWGSACAASPWLADWADQRTVRLTLAAVSPSPIVVGAAVAVRRRTRLSLYRSGAFWYLGKRSRVANAWDVVQPVAGPFLSAAHHGLSVHLLDGAGALTLAMPNAAAVRVELRADRSPDGRAPLKRDTASFDVTLRAESAHRRR